jgi:hypothetical protein
MRLPRIIIIGTRVYFHLWRQERKENKRLRHELEGWQNIVLHRANLPQLYQAPVKVEPVRQPPIGQIAKNAYLAEVESNGSK